MFSWLTKHFIRHFIPHEGNDHRPQILRNSSIRNIVAIVIFFEIFTFLIPTLTHINMTGGMAAVLPGVLSALTNDERQSQNLKTLAVNPILNKAAEMKAIDMAAKGYFAHTSPDGKDPWYWLEKAGYQYQYAGENLAIDFSDSKDVTDAWMESPTHRSNIVKGKYTEVGTGVANGMYEGHEAIFVAQVYANPLPKAPEVLKPVETKKPEIKTTPTRLPAQAGAVEEKDVGITKTEGTDVLGAEVVTKTENADSTYIPAELSKHTFWQKLVASPRNSMNIVLLIVFGVITLALFLNIFIKIKHLHLDLITNGLFVLAIIGAIFMGNYYFSNSNMVIAQSLNYSNEHK